MKETLPFFLSLILLSCGANKDSVERNGYTSKEYSEHSDSRYSTDHKFTAKYEGTSFHECMGRTLKCPKECGQSGNMARFKTVQYHSLTGEGKARRDKMESFNILVSNYYKEKLAEKYVSYISTLSEGDVVKIHVRYTYDTSKSNVFTKEELISITKI